MSTDVSEVRAASIFRAMRLKVDIFILAAVTTGSLYVSLPVSFVQILSFASVLRNTVKFAREISE
jgi:hypothetical protein